MSSTRVGIDLGRRRASRRVLLALLFAAARASGADDVMTNLVPPPAAPSADLDAHPRPDEGRLRLRLAWCDILRRTPFPFEVMRAEVERLLGGENVDVTWRVNEGDGATFVDAEIPVILLDAPRARAARDRHVMGSTPRDGSSRTAWAYSSTVLWALGLTREVLLSPPQEQEFARALGRVVAHEIVHVIAPGIPHGGQGLMQPRMDRSELLKPGLGLENAHRRTFEAQLAARSGAPTLLDRSAAVVTPRRGLP